MSMNHCIGRRNPRTAVEAREGGAERGRAAAGRHVRGDQVIHGRQRDALAQAHARARRQHRRHRQARARRLRAPGTAALHTSIISFH